MRRIVFGTAAALGGVTAVLAGRRAKTVGAVPAELRVPALYVPLAIRNPRELRMARGLASRGTPAVPPGVERRVERVAAAEGRPPVRVLVYEPVDHDPPTGALLWIHGGGYVMGTPEMDDDLCGRIAALLGIVVVSPDYRLAPEHPFPAGLDDCAAALRWLHDEVEALGVDPHRVAVGGASAGGGLAAGLVQRAHDTGTPVCFQLLEYPMLDDRTAVRDEHERLVWTNASNAYGWTSYLGHPAGADDTAPYAVPARRADLAGLPPAWIGIGDADLFHAEDVAYAERLRAAGVPCDLDVVPGMYHAADRMAPDAPSMIAFTDRMIAALGTAVAPTS